MGFLDKKVAGARARQKQALINEAQAAGSRVIGAWDVGGPEESAAGAVGGALKQLFGGRMKADGLQVLLFDTQGFRHAYLQPYDGMHPFPGEHHAILNGCLPSPATLRAAGILGWGTKWDTGQMAGLAKSLNEDPGLTKAVAGVEWEWKTGMVKIDLEWTVQLRSLGDASSHLVLQAGRYGGFTTYEVGFKNFLELSSALYAFLADAPIGEQAFLAPCAFSFAIDVIRTGGLPEVAATSNAAAPAPTPAPAQPIVELDYRPVVVEALTPRLGKKVHLGTGVPPKKEANVRKHVLPPDVAKVEILAVIDLTTFGSAKDALVITPTQPSSQCCMRSPRRMPEEWVMHAYRRSSATFPAVAFRWMRPMRCGRSGRGWWRMEPMSTPRSTRLPA